MNFIKLFGVVALCFSISTSKAQSKHSKTDVLEITGAALLNDERVVDYAISVYLDGTKIDSMYTKSKNTIKFYVAYNQTYTFLFQKLNCVDKIVIVNTQIPKDIKSIKDNTFDFQIEMSQSLSKNSEEVEDYPIAVLYIDKQEEALRASEEYNKFTHNEDNLDASDNRKKNTKKSFVK